MRVSAVITTCNRPEEVKGAVESVLGQTRPPDELIVVDDGDEYPFEPPSEWINRFLLLRSGGRKGACAARNLGAKAANGDILMFLDDDDTWEAKKIARQVEVFDENPEAVLVYTGRLAVDRDNRSKVRYSIPANRGCDGPKTLLLENIVGCTSCGAIRANAFFEAGGFDEEQPAWEDRDLWIRLSRIGKVVPDGEWNVRYTLPSNNRDSNSTGQIEKRIDAIERIREKYSEEYNKMTFIEKRRALANYNFYIAKASRFQNWKYAIAYSVKAFIKYPNPKYIGILLPVSIVRRVRYIVSSK